MSRRRPAAAWALAAALAAAAAAGAGCTSGNPVEPPAPSPPSSSSPLTITILSSLASVEAGSTVGTTLTVSARPAPANGTLATLNTNLGNFGTSASGTPLTLATLKLVGGTATTTFYAGATTGTASILAQVGVSSGSLSLPIVTPAAQPEAGFSFAVGGLSVIFTDTSTGDPTAWTWEFGDGTMSHLENPIHTYAAAKTYLVALSILAAGGMSRTHQFVTPQEPPGVTASFTAAVNGLTAIFTDTSTGGPTSWAWDFGDGSTSSVESPTHTYRSAATYKVSLTVANGSGSTNTATQFVSVGVTGKPPAAAFVFQANGLTVSFGDRSTGGPTSWSWNFGDCAASPNSCTSTQENPTHTYATAGTYNVILTAANAAGQSSAGEFVTVSLGTAPQANFTFQVSGLTVAFADTSTGAPTSWSWSFGDCSTNPSGCTSSQENPTHTYAAAGTYTVTLTVSNAAGQSSKPELVTVTAPAPPQAAFTFQSSGLTVVFTDQSTGSPTSWSWSFGDCSANPAACTSSQQNPSHTYAAAGTYTVSLTVGNAAGSNSVSKLVTVTSGQAPQAAFCYQRSNTIVSFLDRSTNGPTSWAWNFGDCGTQPVDCQSSAQNPTHTYTVTSPPTSFAVSLQATNATGQGNVTHVITIDGSTDAAPICP